MLERIHLENFKASRDVDIRLASLTLLAGLNSSGKSTLLQAIGALRQSYGPTGRTEGLSLSGELIQLGRYGDLLTEGTLEDTIAVTVQEEGHSYRWVFGGAPDANQLQFSEAPASSPRFLASHDFQFLQANRIVPQTLYPQAPQRAREIGFLGPRGEYTAEFLGTRGRWFQSRFTRGNQV